MRICSIGKIGFLTRTRSEIDVNLTFRSDLRQSGRTYLTFSPPSSPLGSIPSQDQYRESWTICTEPHGPEDQVAHRVIPWN